MWDLEQIGRECHARRVKIAKLERHRAWLKRALARDIGVLLAFIVAMTKAQLWAVSL